MRRTALFSTALAVAGVCFTTPVLADDWDHDSTLDTCHAVAMDKLEFHDCRRSFAMRQIDTLRSLARDVIMSRSLDREYFQTLMSHDYEYLQDYLPQEFTDATHAAAIVVSSYPELVNLAHEANQLFWIEASKLGRGDLVETAEALDELIRSRNAGFGRVCEAFLGIANCSAEVDFGNGYPSHPQLDDLLAEASS